MTVGGPAWPTIGLWMPVRVPLVTGRPRGGNNWRLDDRAFPLARIRVNNWWGLLAYQVFNPYMTEGVGEKLRCVIKRVLSNSHEVLLIR